MPLTPYSQFIWINHGTNTDEAIKYANESGDTTATNFATGGPTGTNTGITSPWSIVADLPGGFYYIIDPEFTGNGSADGQIHLGHTATPTVAPTLVYTVPDHNAAPNKFGEANAIAIDTTNHIVYLAQVVYDNSLTGLDNAQTGIVSFTYNPTTGALSAPTDLLTRSGGVTTDANIDEVKQLSLDTTHNVLYFTDDTFGKGTFVSAAETNSVKAYNTVTHVETTVVTFPSASDTNVEYPPGYTNGTIYGVTADPTDNLVFFSTASGFAGAESHNAIYVITPGGTGQVKLTENATYDNMAPFSLDFDDVHNKLYVSYETTNNTAGHVVVYDVNIPTPGSTTGITLSNPLDIGLNLADPTPDGADYPLNGFLDQLPVLTTSGTATHAAEQGTNITLLTGAPTITDSDNDHLSSASVTITGGTFTTATANESSLNDDHLSLNGAASGTVIAGTNITVVYGATGPITMTGYDTLAHYQAALALVQYHTTGDNPTDYGLHNTRTVTWHVSDGALNDPSGTNTTTTTLTIDAVNDAPNIQVLGGNSSSMSLTETNSGFNTSRSLTITDPDSLTETLSLTAANFSTVGPTGGLSDTTLKGFFSVPASANITQTTGSTSFNWTFNSVAQAFDFLAVGETLTLNYNIHDVDSNDSNGPSSTSLSDDQPISVTITGTNDAPTVTGGTTQALTAIAEDSTNPAGQTVTALLGSHFADVDDNAALDGVAIVSNGTSASGKWQWSSDGTTWSDVGTASDASAVLVHAASSLRFLPVTNFNGNAPTLSVRLVDDTQASFSDGATANVSTNGGTTPYSTGTVTLSDSITAVNDAPVASGNATLAAINEDSTNPSGNTVANLFSGNFSDAADNQVASGGSSADNFAGIAITANAATAQGIWQYSTDNGSNWTALPAVSDASAFLLDTAAKLRFVPAADFNGPAPALTTHLVEDSSGAVTSGNTADLSGVGATGGTTQYSSGTVALGETITAVNDAPTVINGATESLAAIDEDTANPSGTLISAAFGGHFSDAADQVPGGSTANAFAGIAVSANAATAAEGKWQWSTNGTTWNDISTGVADTSALLLAASTQLRFLPAANFNGAAPSLTAHLVDDSAGAVTNNTTVNLNVVTTGGTTQYSNGIVALSETINAVDDPPVLSNLGPSPTVTEQIAGQLDNNVTVNDVELDALNGGNGNYDGAYLTIQRSGGANSQDTFAIDGTGASFTVDNTFNTLKVGGNTFATFSVSGGELVLSFVSAGQIPTTALVDEAMQHITYTNTSDNPPATATLQYAFHDGNTGSQGSPGGDASTTQNLVVNITAANDGPVATITPTEYDGSPNNAIDLKNNGLSVSDVDGNAGSETVTLSVTPDGTLTVTAGTSGAGVSGSGTSSVTITGTIAQLNALLNTDGTSTVSFVDSVGGTKTLTLLIHDNGNTGGGDLSASDTASIVLDSPPVVDLNGAPAGTSTTLDYTENDASTAIAPSGFTTDSDSADFNGGVLRVSFTANGASEDQLSILTDSTILLNGSTVQYDADGAGGNPAVDIGTVSGGINGTDLVVSFTTTDATPAAVTALIEHIGYADNSDNPSTAARTLSFLVDDGDGASGTATATINVTAVNDAPTAVITPASYSATEQTSLDLKNNGLAVSDLDGSAGSETVTLSVTEGILNVTAGTSGALVTNSGTASVTIAGTISQINDLLNTNGTSTVSYIDNLDAPAATSTLTLLIHDNGNTGTGGDASASDTATINITAVNDAPVAVLVTDPYTVTENATIDIKNSGMSVSDVDAGAAVVTAALSVTVGILDVAAGGSGAIVSDSGTNSVTISGTLSQINALLNTDATSTVSYTENNDNPGVSGTLTLSINDGGATGTGGAQSGSDSSTIDIAPVNDAPVATITPTSYSATEQTALNLKNSGLSVSDVDGNAGSETVTLSVGEGVLNVTAGSSGAIVSNSGTGSVTIAGTVAQINALLNTDGTSTVSYIDNSDTPGASTTLTLLIHDNGNTGTGGDLSSSDSATINITAVNDAPVFSNLGGLPHPSFIENGSSVALDNDVTISDAELNAAGNYGGAILTLARNGGQNSDDVFAGAGTLDLTHSNGLGENVSLNNGATFIGTATQPGDGTFSITFNSNATGAMVNSVMQQIVYADASDNPPTSVQIDWSFSDGNTGAQGTGGAGVANGSVTVDITQVDDAPVLVNVAPGASYAVGTSGTTLSSGLGVFDVDATPPSVLTGLNSATIRIQSGLFAGDLLFVNLASSGGHFITTDADTTNISGSYNAATGTLTLTGNDTVSHYQSVLDAVSYTSTSADPANGGADPGRTISWVVNDGALNSQTPVADPNNPVSVTFLHFATPPSIDLDTSAPGTGFTATYTENASPPTAIVNSNVLISDADSAALNTADVILTNAKPNDHLTISGALPSGIDSTIDTSVAGQIKVHLFNSASLADYQTALHQIQFSTTDLSLADRDITVSVANDLTSNTAHTTMHVAPLVLNGTAGNDSFVAFAGGNEIFNGGAGVDTVTFGFRLVDATVTYSGNQVIIDAPGSHTVLTGFEVFNFTDGTVHNDDGNPLVDDLYYYSQYHDVWNAHVDADAHYNSVGWHEGRNPDAFFNTIDYLSANPDVRASGVNPLTQYDSIGWTQHHIPSLTFNGDSYLAANPDVAAAHIDPLLHFLAGGAGEGRQPIAPTEWLMPNGFDFVYYLQHNPDVAAAGVDPYQHFETIGWKEGRNPNAFFDTNGYLAAYTDVAAAHINPLDHYNSSGWHEGRDPSVGFDTSSYLAAYPDVAAAHVNPLVHFLGYGIHEGRQPFGDGHFDYA